MIIETSLAPSPIAKEIQARPYFFDRLTTCAFYAGLTQQQITEEAHNPILKNSSSNTQSPKIHVRDLPSITITLLCDFQI